VNKFLPHWHAAGSTFRATLGKIFGDQKVKKMTDKISCQPFVSDKISCQSKSKYDTCAGWWWVPVVLPKVRRTKLLSGRQCLFGKAHFVWRGDK
jgi:hypothetical protein